ncbi:MAG: hypothetical protein CVU56_14905 [Deltaproteobacteria bacterium HGW-Deltaproteobacteria-14]|jgi:hypothetical protein|nr:MAG: hypothetical protein CVU56_14905 [Deltaproteobacteria bacterium HGW-Deltaproteobacteria-14]
MATFPRTSSLAFVAVLLTLGCTSNPTPHPGLSDTAQPDAYVPSGDAQRNVCANLGGQWSDDDEVCTEVDQGFDANAGAAQPPEGPPAADIVGLDVTGAAGDYAFTVIIASDDVDCEHYTDWWEVVLVDGTLVYREVQLHPHVDEQPFTRTGGHLAIAEDALVLVRAHFHPDGYVGVAWVGSVKDGFTAARISAQFAGDLDEADPLPPACTP